MKHILYKSAFAALAVVTFMQIPARAHATLETPEALQGSGYKAVIRIGHGCSGSPTLSVKVKIPEGMVGVKPMPKAGWSVATLKATYAQPQQLYGKPVTEGVTEIIWSGGKLLDEHYDEFVFRSSISATVQTGSTLYVPVTQDCEKGQQAWVEIPTANQNSHDLKAPAPALKITAKQQTADKVMFKVGELKIIAPWQREMPSGAKVAGGYMSIINEGSTPDRLMAIESDIAQTVELHEMSHTNGIMKMQKLETGLILKAGETIKLTPGGYHIMFMGVKEVGKAGTQFPATLVFEKAGRVNVIFNIEATGTRTITDSPSTSNNGEHKH